jgi:hypothetical protein
VCGVRCGWVLGRLSGSWAAHPLRPHAQPVHGGGGVCVFQMAAARDSLTLELPGVDAAAAAYSEGVSGVAHVAVQVEMAAVWSGGEGVMVEERPLDCRLFEYVWAFPFFPLPLPLLRLFARRVRSMACVCLNQGFGASTRENIHRQVPSACATDCRSCVP